MFGLFGIKCHVIVSVEHAVKRNIDYSFYPKTLISFELIFSTIPENDKCLPQYVVPKFEINRHLQGIARALFQFQILLGSF